MLTRSIRIALAIVLIALFGMIVGNSYAFEIERMYPSYGGYYDYSGWLYHSACVETDEPYSNVWWYINDEYVGRSSSHVDNPKTTAYFHAGSSSYPGSPLGKQYKIKAVAQSFMDENGNIKRDTDSYNVYVYSSPVKNEITSGNWTMATMYGQIDVGWNGRTAEVTASASITSYIEEKIIYGFNLRYSIVRLNDNDRWADNIWNQPGGLIEVGTLESKDGSSYSVYYTPNSDSYDGRLLWGGFKYLLQGQVTVTAQPLGGGAQAIDELHVPDTAELFIPKPE